MGFNIGPRVIRATGGSISRQGNFVVHQFPPQHVTDGLVGFIDPHNHDCYGARTCEIQQVCYSNQVVTLAI